MKALTRSLLLLLSYTLVIVYIILASCVVAYMNINYSLYILGIMLFCCIILLIAITRETSRVTTIIEDYEANTNE